MIKRCGSCHHMLWFWQKRISLLYCETGIRERNHLGCWLDEMKAHLFDDVKFFHRTTVGTLSLDGLEDGTHGGMKGGQ